MMQQLVETAVFLHSVGNLRGSDVMLESSLGLIDPILLLWVMQLTIQLVTHTCVTPIFPQSA